MKTISYNKSQIYSGSELTNEQRAEIMNTYNYELSDVFDNSFVKFIDRTLNIEFLPLDMFMRIDSQIWSGVYSLTAFSGYYIKISRDGQTALIAYKYC